MIQMQHDISQNAKMNTIHQDTKMVQ